MRKNVHYKLALFAGVLTMVSMSLAAHAEHPFAGVWNLEVDFPGELIPATLIVMENEDGTLSGRVDSAPAKMEVPLIEYNNGQVTFKGEVPVPDMDMKITFTGAVKDGVLIGEFDTMMGVMPIKGTKGEAGDAPQPIVGKWNVTSVSQLGKLERTLVVNDDQTAQYVTESDAFAVQDLKVQGDQVTFNVNLVLRGQELPLSFRGTLKGDALMGSFLAEGNNVAEITAKRALEDELAAIAGAWKMTAESPLGQLNQAMVINKDGSITFTSDGVASTVRNLKVEGNSVSFDVEFNGYELHLSGAIDENVLSAKYFMGGNPVAEVSGRKDNETGGAN